MANSSALHTSLNAVAVCALLAGCSAAQSTVSPMVAAQRSEQQSKRTFQYTGGEQTFKVPTGITDITITASGASGGGGYGYFGSHSAPGGLAGQVKATISVTPGERLAIFVGGSGTVGGFNGGGTSGPSYGVGGGASDVRQGGDELGHRVVVAAGGGGGGSDGVCLFTTCGYSPGGPGGDGGRRRGEPGFNGQGSGAGSGGGGGIQVAGGSGGAGGAPSCEGSHGKKGAGGAAEASCIGALGGGGGGGYYGGGAGGGGASGGTSISEYADSGGGGGAGSSFAEKSATGVRMSTATVSGNGLVVISW
jgi:hypothetical protein